MHEIKSFFFLIFKSLLSILLVIYLRIDKIAIVKGFTKVLKYYLIASPFVVILGFFLFLSIERQPSDTKIIAFEANPVLATRLSLIFSKSKNICIEHFGLSDTESSNVLFIPFYKKWMFDGLSSFNSDAHVNYFKHHLFNFQEKNVSVKRETCHCKRLDDLSLDPYFIKIDVENFESNVLLGGLETIKKSLPIILIESLDEACVKIMQSLGYRFYEYEDSKEIFVECPPRYNTFCLHPF